MTPFTKSSVVGVLGAGAMGSGIAQIAATAGHKTLLFDTSAEALKKAGIKLQKILNRLVEKGRITTQESESIYNRIEFVENLQAFKNSNIIIEAIIENLSVKQSVFQELEGIVSEETVLATNTSSLSVVSIASSIKNQGRVLGIHFFNPAPLMPLVEIIPCLTSDPVVIKESRKLIDDWGKKTVLAKDTPGFIVNRVARPFYGEAIRIYEEGVADFATIDWAMREIGGFRMGPFQLMDFIGNDINYKVTETVFEQFFYDPRYKPSFTQKRLFEAKRFGRKTGKGYYNYGENTRNPEPVKDLELGNFIVNRVVVMLMNEAIDALFLKIATKEDLDLAMTKGVNYPKGLLRWADEMGLVNVLNSLSELYDEYGEDRYRPSPLLKRMVKQDKKFHG